MTLLESIALWKMGVDPTEVHHDLDWYLENIALRKEERAQAKELLRRLNNEKKANS